jgi:hypothetical protein
VTPCIDPESTAARWHCELFDKDLSVDEQRAGCPSHLFLPHVVPGEQADVADDGSWIEYQMRDGKRWRDGKQEAAK